MTWTYMRTEPGLWTVGWHNDGHWEPESDHGSPDEAADRCHYLNGGCTDECGSDELKELREQVEALSAKVAQLSAPLSGREDPEDGRPLPVGVEGHPLGGRHEPSAVLIVTSIEIGHPQGFGGHEFEYQPADGLFRCVHCGGYVVLRDQDTGQIRPCPKNATAVGTPAAEEPERTLTLPEDDAAKRTVIKPSTVTPEHGERVVELDGKGRVMAITCYCKHGFSHPTAEEDFGAHMAEVTGAPEESGAPETGEAEAPGGGEPVHEHGYAIAGGLGYLADDPACEGCRAKATEAYREDPFAAAALAAEQLAAPTTGQTFPEGVTAEQALGALLALDAPITDAERVSADMDDKAAEVAGEAGAL